MEMDKVDTRPLCHRVVVNDNGLALPPADACLRYGIVARVIFQRRDGMTLGAPSELEDVAWSLWPAQWELFARWPKYESLPMQFYRREAEMLERTEQRLARIDTAVIHLLAGQRSACGEVHGHPCEWPTEPVSHTWVRLDRAWRISCQRCREIATQRLAGKTA